MKRSFIIGAGSLLLLFIGCSTDGPTSSVGKTGTMQVHMVDAPAGYDAVNVVIDSVQAHVAGSDSTSGWFTLNRDSATYDLLTYANGNFAVIANNTLPVGRYSQLRLYVGSGSTVVVDGQTKPLNIPSGVQSGVKLNVDAEISADVIYTLTLDFDANLSVQQSGNPLDPVYHLKPVIRTTTTATTGFISGMVLPASAHAVVWAYSSGGDTLSTVCDALSGAFKLMYVPAETYTIHVHSQETVYADSTMVGVGVTALATANIGSITLRNQ